MSVTLIERPAAIESSIAPSPGTVAGIFTKRFGRSTSSVRSFACSKVASRSYARSGSTSSETNPSTPSVRSQTGRRRSHARLMSSTASAKKTSLVSSERSSSSRSCSSYQSPVDSAFSKIVGFDVTTDDRVLVDEPLQLAGLEHLARQRVDPDADAVLGQLVQSAARHTPTLPPRRRTAVEWRA